MYFSRLLINPHLRKAKAALANPQIVHGMITKAVPPDQQASDTGRLLWRVDQESNGATLYVVTPVAPRLDHIVEQIGWPSAPAETTDYGRMLNSLRVGQQFAFRVALNPVKRVDGKRLPHVSVKHQMQWFLNRTETWGFAIPTISEGSDGESASKNVNIVKRSDNRFSKTDGAGTQNRVVHRVAVFDGLLEVTEPDLLRGALAKGMGSGKAHGCGLMTLARPGP